MVAINIPLDYALNLGESENRLERWKPWERSCS
jgi:hypothetical protein